MAADVKTVPPQPPRPRSVLLIDPNEEHQVLSTMALGRRGYKVTVAGTGREGMRLAVSEPFDAIVVDFKLRDLSAIDVVQALAQRLPGVPKIFVVAPGTEDLAVRALKAGAAGFLVKTPRYSELLPSEVDSQIARAQANQRLLEQGRALGESEDRFAKTFRASPVAIGISSLENGRFIDANDALLRLLECSRDELVGHAVDEIWAVREQREKLLRALKEHGSVRDMELQFRRKSGGTLLGSISAEPIELEGERCLLAIVRDVTMERRSENVRAAIYRISEATAAVRNLGELFPIIHVVVGELMPATNFYIALRAAGSDRLTFPYFVDEQDAPPPPARMGRGLTEYVLRTGEPLLASPDVFDDLVKRGEVDSVGPPSVDWLGVPLVVKGEVIGVMTVQTYTEGVRYREDDKDILTFVSGQVAMAIERVRAEDEIRARASQQTAVAELGQRALAGVDLPTLFSEAAELVTRVLGVEYCAVLELRPERAELHLRAGVGWNEGLVGRATVSPAPEFEPGYTLARKEPVVVEDLSTETRFHSLPLLLEHGVVSGISVIVPGADGPFGVLGAHASTARRFGVDDVHFLQAVANVLAAAIDRGRQEKALAESERLASMGQLAAYVAREINTPLTSISLLAEGIARRTDDREIREKIEKIHVQRRNAAAIITNLPIPGPRHSLQRASVDLRTLIGDAVEQVRPHRAPGVELIMETGDRPVLVDVDAVQIRHVLRALLRTGLEGTVRGSVTIRLREERGHVVLEVQDTGNGMSREVLEQLFNPLSAAKRKGDEPGLGLSACRSAVEAHGGTLEATSELGKGSTFTVILPR